MTGRLLLATAALAVLPHPSFAAILLPFDPQSNTWNATHIIVVESGRVVESWKGDLKVGDALPIGVARFTEIPVPGPDPGLKRRREPEPVVTGKRMVLFLALMAPEGQDPAKRVWIGTSLLRQSSNEPSQTDVAWVEGDNVYSVGLPDEGTSLSPHVLRKNGSIAGLKQRVDLGLALRAQFEAAKADMDVEKRAERLVVLMPIVAKYAGLYGRKSVVREVSKCGKAGVPYLARWQDEPKGECRTEALYALCGLGDVGIDAVIRILDDETKYWKAAAQRLKAGQRVQEVISDDPLYWRGPNRLHHVLQATRGMKLASSNEERLQNHPGLQELNRLFINKPGLKPEKTDMVGCHEILQDILAGKFQIDE